MKNEAYIFLADGFEEIEALTVVDLLRRAEIRAQMVSITEDRQVTGAHGIQVSADLGLADAFKKKVEAYILPGGMPGTRNLQACKPLIETLKEAVQEERLVAAICAAPLILGQNHLLEGKKASCYPGFEADLLGAKVSMDPVSKDGRIITSRGMGTAIAFSAEIIASLLDRETADQVLESIIYE